jgi:hypothetical protein
MAKNTTRRTIQSARALHGALALTLGLTVVLSAALSTAASAKARQTSQVVSARLDKACTSWDSIVNESSLGAVSGDWRQITTLMDRGITAYRKTSLTILPIDRNETAAIARMNDILARAQAEAQATLKLMLKQSTVQAGVNRAASLPGNIQLEFNSLKDQLNSLGLSVCNELFTNGLAGSLGAARPAPAPAPAPTLPPAPAPAPTQPPATAAPTVTGRNPTSIDEFIPVPGWSLRQEPALDRDAQGIKALFAGNLIDAQARFLVDQAGAGKAEVYFFPLRSGIDQNTRTSIFDLFARTFGGMQEAPQQFGWRVWGSTFQGDDIFMASRGDAVFLIFTNATTNRSAGAALLSVYTRKFA